MGREDDLVAEVLETVRARVARRPRKRGLLIDEGARPDTGGTDEASEASAELRTTDVEEAAGCADEVLVEGSAIARWETLAEQ